MSAPKEIRIATRASALALWQANTVADRLRKLGATVALHEIASEGDSNQLAPLSQIGGQGVFTKAVDDALLNGIADIAVHSCKDMPTRMQAGLVLAAVLEREDPRDVLVLADPQHADRVLADPSYAAHIATGSPRRKAFWQNKYPAHRISELRGNVPTRIEKIQKQGLDGAIFAAAGLKRLNLHQHIHENLDWLTPAVGQGAVAISCREADTDLRALLTQLNDHPTWQCITVERAYLRTLQGGCTAPIAGHATRSDDGTQLHFEGVYFSPDFGKRVTIAHSGQADAYEQLGVQAAEMLLTQNPEIRSWS